MQQGPLMKFHGIDIADCRKGCDHAGVKWWPELVGGCPNRALAEPVFVAVMQLWNARQVAPLDGWPHKYSYWAQHGLMTVEDGMTRARAEA